MSETTPSPAIWSRVVSPSIDAPGGDLQQFGLSDELLDLDQARAAITAKAVA